MDPYVDLQRTDNRTPAESTVPPPRMTRQQTLTLISMASVNFSSMICYSILGPFFPNEAVKKGASQTVIGLIFGCYAVCNLIGSLILGKYIVQIGAKFMLIMGLFVSSACTIMFGLLNRVPAGPAFITLCFVVRSVDAIGFAAAMTSSFAMTAKIFPNNVATVLGSLEIFTGLGLILGPPVGGWFYQSFGYEVPFMLLGCLLLIMVPFNIYVLPNIESDPSKDSFIRLLTKVKIVLICYVIFTLSSGLGFLDATLSLFAMETFGLSSGYVGLIMLGLSLPYCLASPLLGYITDKYPSTRPWFVVTGGTATAIGFCLLGPAPFLYIPSQLWLLIVMLGVIGFSLGMTAIPTFPEIIKCAYEQGYEEGLSTLGMVSGLFGAFWSLGMFYGPIVGGIITQHLNFEWAAAVQGGLAFLGAFLLALHYLCQHPQHKNFKGVIHELGQNQYLVSGEVSVIDRNTIEITELPIRTWTQAYKESVLEPMLQGTDKTPALISDYKEYHTDTTVKFVVRMSEEKLAQAETVGLHKVFKLQSSLTCNSMVLFDHMGCLKRYDSVQDILREFFELRLHYYKLRKDWLLGSLGAEAAKLSNQARFVLEKIEGKISIENKTKRELIRMLVQKGFESDPVAAWAKAQEKAQEEDYNDGNDSDSSVDSGSTSGPNFNYILNMPLWCLTKEKVDELLKQRDHKRSELNDLQRKSPEDLWKEDLSVFIEELDKVEAQEREEQSSGKAIKLVKGKVGKPKVKKMNLEETMPSPFGRRVEPPTQAIRSDAAKKLTKKKKSDIDPAVKLEFDEDGLGGEGAPPTGENSVAKPKAPRVKREKKEPGAPRVRKPPGPKGTPAKKVKKRNPWSEDDSKSDSDVENSKPVIPRETKSQRASASKPKYTFDFSEEEDEEEAADEEENGDDYVPSSPVRSFKDDFPSSDTKDRFNDHNDDEDDDDNEDSYPAPKQKTTSAPVAKKTETTSIFSSKSAFSEKSNDSDGSKSDSDDDRGPVFSTYSSSSAFDKLSPAKKAAKKPSDAAPKPKKPPAPKAKKPDKSIWDSDSDTGSKKPAPALKGKGRGRKRKGSGSEDEYSPMKKAAKPVGRKPQKPPSDDEDDDSNSLSALSAPSRDRPGRAKKEVKYFDESDNGDEDDDDDMFD